MQHPPLLVACLCAQWCGTCRDYAPVFGAAPRADGQHWAWVDIEDHAEVLGDIDVDNFPSLLIARGAEVVFFGSVTPHASTLQRLVASAAAGELTTVNDAAVAALAGRVRAFAAPPTPPPAPARSPG